MQILWRNIQQQKQDVHACAKKSQESNNVEIVCWEINKDHKMLLHQYERLFELSLRSNGKIISIVTKQRNGKQLLFY